MHHRNRNPLLLQINTQQPRRHIQRRLTPMPSIIPSVRALVPQRNTSALSAHHYNPGTFLQQSLRDQILHEKRRTNSRCLIHQELLLVAESLELLLGEVAGADDKDVYLRVIVLHGDQATGVLVRDVDVGDPVYAVRGLGGGVPGCCVDSLVFGGIEVR